MNLSFYKNKKILITGNTGFKGSWLTLMLLRAGAKVFGLSDAIPRQPSLYELCHLHLDINQVFADLAQPSSIEHIKQIQPEVIIHLAAQPLMSRGVEEPRFTIENNVSCTLTVLEYLRQTTLPTTAIFITSDKCYLNEEWHWGYREIDKVWGVEPYGASKAMCEMVANTYYHTYFKQTKHIQLATTRAGNVIGGGDFTDNRIIPDCMRAWKTKQPIMLRNKLGVRPWQHVIEPLSGYLLLCEMLSKNPGLNGEAWNFGPSEMAFHRVDEVVKEFASHLQASLPDPLFIGNQPDSGKHEATLLKISSEKALAALGWKPKLDFYSSVRLTAEWYSAYLKNPQTLREVTMNQIDTHLNA